MLTPVVRVSSTPPTVTTYVAEIVTVPASSEFSVPIKLPAVGISDSGSIDAFIVNGSFSSENVIVPSDEDVHPLPSFTSTVAVISCDCPTAFVALAGVKVIFASTYVFFAGPLLPPSPLFTMNDWSNTSPPYPSILADPFTNTTPGLSDTTYALNWPLMSVSPSAVIPLGSKCVPVGELPSIASVTCASPAPIAVHPLPSFTYTVAVIRCSSPTSFVALSPGCGSRSIL